MKRALPWAACALLLFAALAWIQQHPGEGLYGDEWRYLYYADNLRQGFYSPREPVYLWNGPGYPLFLVPLVALGGEALARYANAALFSGAVGLLFVALRALGAGRLAWVGAGLLAAYPPLWSHLPMLYSEVLAVFLCCAWLAAHAVWYRGGQRWALGLAAAALAGLALTKVAVGTALMLSMAASAAALLVPRWRGRAKRAAAVCGLGLGLCLPYLGYTCELTDRFPYWGSPGAMSLYWTASPYPEELGDWHSHNQVFRRKKKLNRGHVPLFMTLTGRAGGQAPGNREQILHISSPEAADAFRAAALENMTAHPARYLRNVGYNLSRLLTDHPRTLKPMDWGSPYLLGNLMLLLAGAAGLRRRGRGLAPALILPTALVLTWLALHLAVAAMGRFLLPMIPIFIGFVFSGGQGPCQEKRIG